MSAHNIHLQDKKKKISLNCPYIVFGGNLCGLKNVFDSSMVNEPLGFERLKFYCIEVLWLIWTTHIYIYNAQFKGRAICIHVMDNVRKGPVCIWEIWRPILVCTSTQSDQGLLCQYILHYPLILQTVKIICLQCQDLQLFIAPDKALFLIKICQFFLLFIHKNVCCGYSMPWWGTSNEYPQHMFS